jgi:hypothetical protein
MKPPRSENDGRNGGFQVPAKISWMHGQASRKRGPGQFGSGSAQFKMSSQWLPVNRILPQRGRRRGEGTI